MAVLSRVQAAQAANHRRQRILLLLAAATLAVVVLSVLLGRYPTPGLLSLTQLSSDELASRLVWNLRVPRVLTGLLLGATLAAAGMVFQLLFANPLVEPGFLGVSPGAAFGAALAIVLLGGTALVTQSAAALFALAGLALSTLLAQRIRYGGWVLLARAIAQAPRLLLLDEPTAHLDLHNKSRLVQIMRSLRSRGVTMLMTSHEPDVVLAVADDVLLMESGRPPQFGPLDEIFTAEALSRIYDLRIQLATVDGRRHVLWT